MASGSPMRLGTLREEHAESKVPYLLLVGTLVLLLAHRGGLVRLSSDISQLF